MSERVKLQEPGSELSMQVHTVSFEKISDTDYVKFDDGARDLLVPLKSVERQLERLGVEAVKDLSGMAVKFSRSTELNKYGKSYWNLDPANAADLKPQPESKRVASPYREPGQRTATVVPGGELPEPPHGGLPPDWSDVPPPELEGEELPNEAAYRALARRVAAFQAQLGKEFEMPFDGSSVNSMTATIWINNR